MLPLLPLAAAGLLAQAGPAAPPPVDVEAPSAAYDATRDRYLLSGGATLRRGRLTLRAPTIAYDAAAGTADATGGDVLLLEPGRAVGASSLHLVLDGPYEARDVTAFFKDLPLDLGAAPDLEAARRAGRNRASLRAERVLGVRGEERFRAEHARLTLCDCGGAAPTWELRASHADVVPGERAILTFPVLYITPRFLFIQKPVPVLPLPWLYVPLGDRQTGLLLPEVNNGSRIGWAFSEPLFVTLGRSADATLTADYAFGPGDGAMRRGQRGVRGPGASLELRWAPAEGSGGFVRVYDLHDTARDYVTDAGGVLRASPPHGERIAVTLHHAERFSERTSAVADVGLVNDPLYVQDFTVDVLLRSAEYRRSAAALAHRLDDVVLEADAAYHLPLGNLGQQSFAVDPTNGLPRVPYGLFGGDVSSAFHRLPSASATLLPVPLLGPLRLSGSLGVARFAPVRGSTGDEGLDGLGPGDRGWAPGLGAASGGRGDAGEYDGRWERGERLAATRAAARAEIRAPLRVARVLAIEPWVRAVADGYAFEAARPARLSAIATAGVSVSTEIARTFGSGDGRWLHVIEPRAEWRGGTGALGGPLPAFAYDELDAAPPAPGDPCTTGGVAGRACLPLRALSAAPPGPWSQLRLAVRTRLVAPAGPLSRSALEVEVGQDVDLERGALSESFARGQLIAGPVRASLLARFRAFGALAPSGTWAPTTASWLDRFTELRADVALLDGRGDDLPASLLGIGAGGSAQLAAGLEPLFDARALPLDAVAQGSAGIRLRLLGGLAAGYDALFDPRRPGGLHVQQHVVNAGWDSPCHCWKAAIFYARTDAGETQFRWVFDLSQIAASRFGF